VIRWSLKKWALLAEVIGGIGIIVSILYLALEINQNTESVQAVNHLALIEQLGVVRSWNVLDAEFAEIANRGFKDFESLGEVERSRFIDYTDQHFDVWELGFSMGERGLVPKDIMDAFNGGYCQGFMAPGPLLVWETYTKGSYSADFVENVDGCFATAGFPTGQPE
jgi:hypothetical protein